MAKMTNLQLWNYLRKTNPNFRNHTSEGTKDLFTEKGFEALSVNDVGSLNDFFLLSIRVAFQKINVATAKNPLAGIGLVEVYENPTGGYIQRMQIDSFKPTTPKFKNLQNGHSVDMQKVRKGQAKERFFETNFDFASFYSLQEFAVKQIFISEYGMADFIAGFMTALQNGYTVQEYVNVLNCLSAGLNSTKYPLKDSQKLVLDSWTDEGPTASELTGLILQLKDLATIMETSASTKAFNAIDFDTAYDPDDFVVLMRAGIKNRIATALMVGAFNPETLTIPFEIKEVEHFGGLRPYVVNENVKTYLYDVYDSNGEQIGYSAVDGATVPTYTDDEVEWEDPNKDILCVVAQRGIIFEATQNPLQVLPAPYNVAGLYQNWHMTRPNTLIAYDALYGCITISRPYDLTRYLTVSGDIGEDTDLLGKVVSDLQTDVNVVGDKITGTLKYVTGYTGFSGDQNEQSGNYLALKITDYEADEISVKLKNGIHTTPQVLDSDGIIVIRISDITTQDEVIVYVTDTDGVTFEKSYDISELTLQSA